jgi:methionyl-tRNA formyltransferase
MTGDEETGVTVMRMEEGLDTGPIASKARVPIEPDATAGDLREALARIGADLMLDALGELDKGTLTLTSQSESGATYANKVSKNETRIDWSRPCQEVHNQCRGLSPEPGAWFDFPGVGRVKVLRTTIGREHAPPGHVIDDRLTIGCGQGSLRLVEIQRAGGKPMPAETFLHGIRSARVAVVH